MASTTFPDSGTISSALSLTALSRFAWQQFQQQRKFLGWINRSESWSVWKSPKKKWKQLNAPAKYVVLQECSDETTSHSLCTGGWRVDSRRVHTYLQL